MSTNLERLKQIIEGTLLAAGRPLSIDQILTLFLDEDQPSRDDIRNALESLKADCETRGVELAEVSSGFRFQVKSEFAMWVSRLWEEKPSRYSRAVLETLALIAYRQPITRSEIEDVRGVSVSSNIVKSLLEREWVRVVGHRDVPGRPALYGTTKQFLDYFNLKGLSDLPPLAELRNIESIERELDFGDGPPTTELDAAANDDSSQDDDETPIVTAEMAFADSDEVVADDDQVDVAEDQSIDVDDADTEGESRSESTLSEEASEDESSMAASTSVEIKSDSRLLTT